MKGKHISLRFDKVTFISPHFTCNIFDISLKQRYISEYDTQSEKSQEENLRRNDWNMSLKSQARFK